MNAEQKAIDAWFNSEEGKSCANLQTLVPGVGSCHEEFFLHNRLWKALIDGISAGQRIERERIMGKLSRLLD